MLSRDTQIANIAESILSFSVREKGIETSILGVVVELGGRRILGGTGIGTGSPVIGDGIR